VGLADKLTNELHRTRQQMDSYRPLLAEHEDRPLNAFAGKHLGRRGHTPVALWHGRFSEWVEALDWLRRHTGGRAGEVAPNAVKGFGGRMAFRGVPIEAPDGRRIEGSERDGELLRRVVAGLREAARPDSRAARLWGAYVIDGFSTERAVKAEDPTAGKRNFERWAWWRGLATPDLYPTGSADQLRSLVRHLDQALVTVPGLVAAPEEHPTAASRRFSMSSVLQSKLIGPFVGRRQELEDLQQAWIFVRDRSSDGAALIAGEAGIGKTELLHEWIQPMRPSADVVVVQLPTDGARAHSGVAALVGELVQLGHGATRDIAADETALRTLGRLVPDVFGTERGRSANPAGDREALCDAIAALLRRASAVRPVVVVFEDLHRATSDTWTVVMALIRDRVPNAMVVATYRPEEADAATVDGLHAVVRDATVHRHLELDFLSKLDLVELAAGVAPGNDPEELGEALFTKTGGNALYATSVLKTVLEGAGEIPTGRLDGGDMPAEIAEHLGRKFRRLTPGAREVAGVAAVCGPEVEVELLVRLMGKSIDEIVPHLVELEGARFIAPSAGGQRIRFFHELNHDAAYDGVMSKLARAQLHRRLVDEIGYPAPPEAVALYAHHSYMAAQVYHTLRARSVEASRSAAADAVERMGYGAAEGHYRRALELADDDVEEAHIRADLGDTLWRLGRTPEARAELLGVVDLAREFHQVALLGQIATTLAAVSYQSNDADPVLRRLFEEVRDLQPEDEFYYRIRMAFAIGRETSPLLVPQVLPQIAALTVKLAAKSDDPATRAYGHFIEIESLLGHLAVDRRAELSQQMIAAAEEARDPYLLSAAQGHKVYAALESLDPVGIYEGIDACRDIAERFRFPYARWDAASYAAGVALVHAPLDEARALVKQAVDVGGRLEYGEVELMNCVQTAFLLREEGRIEESEHIVRQGASDFEVIAWKAGLACGLCEAVDPDKRAEAPEWIDRVESVGLETLPCDGTYPLTLAFMAEAYAYQRDQDGASALLALIERCHRHPVVAGGALYWGSIDYHAGLLHATLGQYDRALDRFATAYRNDVGMSAWLWVCHTLIAQSQVLRLRGGPGDDAKAERCERQARRKAREKGYERVRQELDGERPRHIATVDEVTGGGA
jgi:tetratricopeptide (TPR) repeat protein